MREEAADLWSWLGKGAHFYVCGDAKRMAADVDATLVAVCARTWKEWIRPRQAFREGASRAQRYQTDVY